MSLQDTARSAFGAIKTALAECVVTVIYNGQTCQGLKDTQADSSGLTTMGEQGATTGIVRVDASELAEPTREATMIVDGKNVFCVSHKLDPAGALRRIEYSQQRPITYGDPT